MKLFKLFLTTLMVFSLSGLNPVKADHNVINISNEQEFLDAAEKGGKGTTWNITHRIDLTKLNNAGTLTNNSYITIPADTTIIGNNNVIVFNLGETKLTKVMYALGDISINGLSISAPFKSDSSKDAYQFTPTLISFSKDSNKISLSNLNLYTSHKSVEVDQVPHSNYGVGLYFSSKDANVTFDNVTMNSGRLQFVKNSRGKVTFTNNSYIGQEAFLSKDGIEDEVIYVVDNNSWNFSVDKTSSFDLGGVLSSETYLDELFNLIGPSFSAPHGKLTELLKEDLTSDKLLIKLSSKTLWNEDFILDILNRTVKDGKYGYYKDTEFILDYGISGKNTGSDLTTVGHLVDGELAAVGEHKVSIVALNPKIGLAEFYNNLFSVVVTKNTVTPETHVTDKDVLEQFGSKKPVVNFPEGAFVEPVEIDFGPSTIKPDDLTTAIGYINKSLLEFKIGRTFTIDIRALSSIGSVVESTNKDTINVTVPIPMSLVGAKALKVYYIDQNDYTATALDTIVNADGTISFLTTHFSNYMIAEVIEGEVEELPVPTPEPEPKPEPKPEPTPEPKPEPKPEPETEPVVKPVEKPVVKDPTGPVLPPTGVSSSLAIGAPLAILGVLMIGLDQLKRYMKKLNN